MLIFLIYYIILAGGTAQGIFEMAVKIIGI